MLLPACWLPALLLVMKSKRKKHATRSKQHNNKHRDTPKHTGHQQAHTQPGSQPARQAGGQWDSHEHVPAALEVVGCVGCHGD